MGIGRFAYNWRTQDNPQFEEEILLCKRNGIEFFAFWNENGEAFALFEKYDLHPQIWKTLQSPQEDSQEEKVETAFKRMLPYLLCININGMANKDTLKPKSLENKILPIGSGLYEKRMIQAIIESGYDGPIGIIDHLDDQDTGKSLRDNLAGLDLF